MEVEAIGEKAAPERTDRARTELRALLVEDESADVELLLRFSEKGWL